jgi:hypothetical protein
MYIRSTFLPPCSLPTTFFFEFIFTRTSMTSLASFASSLLPSW